MKEEEDVSDLSIFSVEKETRLRSHGFDVSHGSTNTAQAFLLLLLSKNNLAGC